MRRCWWRTRISCNAHSAGNRNSPSCAISSRPPGYSRRNGRGCEWSLHPRVHLPQKPTETWIDVARKYRLQIGIAELLRHQLAQHVAKVGGEVEIPAFVQLFFFEPGPVPVNLASSNVAAHDE